MSNLKVVFILREAHGEKNNVGWKVYNCDCREMLNEYILPATIDCIVTSPPYYNLRSYGDTIKIDGNIGKWEYSNRKIAAKNEIGIACKFSQYLNDLSNVFEACYKVLKTNKFMFINIGNKHKDKQYVDYSREIIDIAKNSGFIHCDTIIWIKRNAQPMGRFKQTYLGNGWEYILMFAKGRNYKINFDAYLETSSHFRCKKCGMENFVQLKSNPNYFYSTIGCFGNEKKKKGHPAPFPETVPRFCLSIATHEYDMVLDPFAGSGTTLKVALDMKLNCVGCELIEKLYLDLIDNIR